jgi:NAD(P)-dependent dehydrogenase (short-subunit alcohol dehydrogenase family)
MQNKPVALVTEANKVIGLQIARDLVAHGFTATELRHSDSNNRTRQAITPGCLSEACRYESAGMIDSKDANDGAIEHATQITITVQ